MKMLLNYLKPNIPKMSLGLSIKFTGTMMDLLLPWILAYLLDDVVPLKDMPRIFLWGLVMMICSVVALVTNIIANRMAAKVARDVTQAIRHDLFVKTMYLSSNQINHFTIPSLVSRLTSDTYNIHKFIGMLQRIGVRAPILLIGGIIITLTLEPILALVLVAVFPLISFTVYFISKKAVPLYQKSQQIVDKLVGIVQENIIGIRVIKALSKTEYEKKRFSLVNSEVSQSEQKASITVGLTSPLMDIFLNLGLTMVIIVGAYRVNLGLTQPGKIIAFLSYFTLTLNAMITITRIFMRFTRAKVSAERIEEVLSAPEELTAQAPDHIDSVNHITFDNVSFSYHKKQDDLKNISFALKKGQTLGIIGATGSGKTTIISLLLRFYDADSGTIRINGDNIKSIPSEILHTKFGVAMQNDFLMAATLAENIDFGRELSREQIALAAEHAQAKEFIDSLPDGLDHELTIKGSNLSGGQKQRVLISRALAGKPEILILDDSSSALDYKTDAKLRRAIHENYDTTTIIVAQRISSIMNADHILVLEDGEVIGSGTHEQLMQACPSYQEISESQMGVW